MICCAGVGVSGPSLLGGVEVAVGIAANLVCSGLGAAAPGVICWVWAVPTGGGGGAELLFVTGASALAVVSGCAWALSVSFWSDVFCWVWLPAAGCPGLF